MERNKLKRISPARAAKQATATRLFEDCHGVAFCEYRLWLPARVCDWPQVHVVKNSRVCDLMHRMCYACFICGGPPLVYRPLEAHHIIGGAHRSDELTNVAILCRFCHQSVQHAPRRLKDVLLAKWQCDREHTSWVRLAQLHGRFFAFNDLEL